MAGEAERVDAYLDTVRRLEPDIAMIDQGAGLASIAISLKRIADSALSVQVSFRIMAAGFATLMMGLAGTAMILVMALILYLFKP